MAALSVQSASGARVASASALRSSELAATPPTTAIRPAPSSAAAGAGALDERRDDRALVGGGQVGPPALQLVRRQVAHRVEKRGLQAGEGEVEAGHARDREGRTPPDRRRGRRGRARRLPDSPARAGARPCRRPRRRRRRASSPRPRSPRASRTSRSSVCPPLASRQRNGGSSGSGWRYSEATCPCRWSTGISGSRRDQASAFAAERPTRSAPISPGPCVTATDSTSSSVAPPCSSAAVSTGPIKLEVPARGDLGHDAAVARVQLGLGGDDVRAHVAASRDERDRRLVAGGLDRRGSPGPHGGGGSFHMISASSRFSTGETMFPPWAPFYGDHLKPRRSGPST